MAEFLLRKPMFSYLSEYSFWFIHWELLAKYTNRSNLHSDQLCQYRLLSFSSRGYKIRKMFVQESTYPKKIIEFLELVHWEGDKFDFQRQFSKSKIIQILLNFFSLKNINLQTNFLCLTFFDIINFQITSFSKPMPNFWHLHITPILEIQ